jgi:hypothetical protein
VTCAACLEWKPKYERMLAPGYRPEDDDPDVLRRRLEEAREETRKVRERLRLTTDEKIADLAGPTNDLLCAEISRLKAEVAAARKFAGGDAGLLLPARRVRRLRGPADRGHGPGEGGAGVSETTELDKTRRYLVPVARVDLPDEPSIVHLALYEWVPRLEDWANGPALCSRSTQGVLPEGTEVTCPDCQHYQPTYEAVLNTQHAAAGGALERRRRRDAAGDTTENGAWHTVWLESGKWRWTTQKMTTPQREYAADCVAAYSRYLATEDGDLERAEPEGLRWWREEGR